MIEFKNVKLNIKNTDILNDISFTIYDNSVVAFVGNKNSGKSTLLKVMAGIYHSYSGEINIDGKDINSKTDKIVDVVHENREKNTELTVIEYLDFYADLYGSDKKKAESLIDRYLKFFSIMSLKHTNLENLDKETYKLIDIIRVLIHDPDAILFDNLFFSDNVDYNRKLVELVRYLMGKKTIVFFSRNLDYIEDMSEYIGVLEAGTLIAYGKKDEIYKRAELNKKIEVEIIDNIAEAVELLKNDANVSNIIYDDRKITFSIIEKGISNNNEILNIEFSILKKLIDNNIKVYSFKKEQVRFEQLQGKLL